MGQPNKTFYSILEAAVRWGRSIPEIMDWAAGNHLPIVTFLGYADSDEGPIAGTIEISGADMLSHFRIDGPAQRDLRIYRARKFCPESAEGWVFVKTGEGEPGIPISQHDIYIPAAEFLSFQEAHDLAPAKEKIVYRTPRSENHDWEGMYVQLCRRIFEIGLPESLKELTRETQEWFIQRSEDGEAPDESSIRKRLQPIWNELRGLG